jgi:hypothetical protein
MLRTFEVRPGLVAHNHPSFMMAVYHDRTHRGRSFAIHGPYRKLCRRFKAHMWADRGTWTDKADRFVAAWDRALVRAGRTPVVREVKA